MLEMYMGGMDVLTKRMGLSELHTFNSRFHYFFGIVGAIFSFPSSLFLYCSTCIHHRKEILFASKP